MTKRISRLRRRVTGLVGALLLLGGCSFVDNALLPSLTGEYNGGSPTDGLLLLGSSDFSTPDIDDSETSRTPAGQRIEGLRGELLLAKEHIDLTNRVLQRLRTETREAATEFEDLLGELRNSRKRRNPPPAAEIERQRQAAEVALARVAQSVGQLNDLLKEASSNAAEAGRLVEATTLALTSLTAGEEDQEQLTTLQEESTRMSAVAYRLQSELSEDILQANNYLTRQRTALNTLAPPPADEAVEVGTEVLTASDPLVIIRFDRPDVEYEAIVTTAVKQALEAEPTARVYLVAVAPDAEGQPGAARVARDRMQGVMDLLIANGVPATRITPSARTSPTTSVDEVHIFVR